MAMETSKSSKTEAVLDLYDALRHGKRVQRREWCQEHGLTTKTFERYIANLRDHLYEKNMRTGQRQTIDFNQETETYHITGKENTWISDGELIAICKILIAVRAFEKKDLLSLLSRLLTVVVSKKGKEEIEKLMKNELYLYEDPAHESMDRNIFFNLVSAVQAHHVVCLTYKKPEDEVLSTYTVKAGAVLFDRSYFYFIGQTEDGERAFRLDRIFNTVDSGKTFTEPYHNRFQPGIYRKQAPYMFNGKKEHVSFLCSSQALEPLLNQLPSAQYVREGEHCRVDLDVKGEEGILMILLAQGSRVRILSPKKLVDRWVKEAEAICRMGK